MHKNIKIKLELECDFKNLEQEMTHKFQLPNAIIRGQNDLINYWDTQRDLFISRCDELEAKGSGWALSRIDNIRININKYKLLSGSSYIALPKWIEDKKACINIKK